MVIFDFDGVMIDSLDEVVINSYNCVSGQLVNELGKVPSPYPELFRLNRFHVQPAGDLIVLARWCLEQAKAQKAVHLLTRPEWESLVKKTTDSLDSRRELFFGQREKLIALGKKAWLDLNRPYRPLWDTLLKLNPNRIPVLTNKNRDAARELCNHFGLPLKNEQIYAGDKGATKSENFALLEATFKEFAPFYFIDDSVDNLIELRAALDPEVCPKMLFASWGYVGPADAKKAMQHGIPVYTQNDLITLLQQSAWQTQH